jgi:dTDP-4-dehydrorhamnose reductase
MRVLVTGAAGQLGRVIAERADPSDFVAAFTRQQLDITNRDVVQRAVSDAHPDAVINCAAFNEVDGAQDRPVEAFAANALGVAELARAAAEAGAVFVQRFRLRRRVRPAVCRDRSPQSSEPLRLV